MRGILLSTLYFLIITFLGEFPLPPAKRALALVRSMWRLPIRFSFAAP